MNIVWFTWKDRQNPLAGGAEVVADELATRLVKAGHRVTFITAGFPGAAAHSNRHGYHIVRVGSRYTSYFAAWRYYRQHRTNLAADLVIDECNTMPYFAGWYSHTRTILLFHMLCREIWFYQFPQPLSTLGYLLEPLYLRLLKRTPVITVSESSRQDLIRYGFSATDISLISEGTELGPVPSLRSIQKYTQPTMLSLGAMRPMKRTLHQIRAFELAKSTLPNLRLIIAGDSSGAYGQKVLRSIRTSPYAADIHYLGRVSQAKKVELMQRSHLITVTSIKEGWGLIVTEAASQGTPAVVYNADGLRDSVRDQETGLVTPTNTPAALAAKVTELMADPTRYQRLRRAAWQWSQTINFDRSYKDFLKAIDPPKKSPQATVRKSRSIPT